MDSNIFIQKIEKATKKLLPYNIVIIIVFFSLPLILSYAKNDEQITALLLIGLYHVNPQISFFSALVYGIRNGFKWSYCFVVAWWFFVCTFLFYGIQFSLFILIYTVCALVGCWFGSLLKGHIDEMYL